MTAMRSLLGKSRVANCEEERTEQSQQQREQRREVKTSPTHSSNKLTQTELVPPSGSIRDEEIGVVLEKRVLLLIPAVGSGRRKGREEVRTRCPFLSTERCVTHDFGGTTVRLDDPILSGIGL